MPNRHIDTLYQLVKSLEKSEKRNFKLYVTRNSSAENLKVIELFDALDKMNEYDEVVLLKKTNGIKKQQLSNLKAHCYRQILSSLRSIRDDQNIDIQLHEQMGYARILYNKGLYLQSLKLLDRLKELARQHNQVTFLMQAIFFEKKIEALHITRSNENRATWLVSESEEVTERIHRINASSNLSLLLYDWYIRHGHARNKQDEAELDAFFVQHLPKGLVENKGFYEQLYVNQSYSWYAFIRQDFLMYYRYTTKWVELFQKHPEMIKVETLQYIKGLHNLLSAHFDLRNLEGFAKTLHYFEALEQMEVVQTNDNNRIQAFIYLQQARINHHFLDGSFTAGLELIPYLEEKLEEYELQIDRHRILVFYYKIACLYFGSGDNERAIDYLQKIINRKVDLRTDLQCYARLLHLIAHYELGNFDLLEYLTKSVYRFMAKMGSLSVVEEEMFKFLRSALNFEPGSLKEEFRKLLVKIKPFENDPRETRTFAYLDVISWLESKVDGLPVQEVIRRKSLLKRKK
jgi:tetratricopeptide (TPR) repeat protein